jgi:hypothetical protein
MKFCEGLIATWGWPLDGGSLPDSGSTTCVTHQASLDLAHSMCQDVSGPLLQVFNVGSLLRRTQQLPLSLGFSTFLSQSMQLRVDCRGQKVTMSRISQRVLTITSSLSIYKKMWIQVSKETLGSLGKGFLPMRSGGGCVQWVGLSRVVSDGYIVSSDQQIQQGLHHSLEI